MQVDAVEAHGGIRAQQIEVPLDVRRRTDAADDLVTGDPLGGGVEGRGRGQVGEIVRRQRTVPPLVVRRIRRFDVRWGIRERDLQEDRLAVAAVLSKGVDGRLHLVAFTGDGDERVGPPAHPVGRLFAQRGADDERLLGGRVAEPRVDHFHEAVDVYSLAGPEAAHDLDTGLEPCVACILVGPRVAGDRFVEGLAAAD